jgi:hypothetical protein
MQTIDAIVNEQGAYLAHQYFEIRNNIFHRNVCGYGKWDGYVDPMEFIQEYNLKE